MDSIDLSIINDLNTNGRTPAAEIAKRLDVSARVAQYRIEKLIREGIVRVTAIVDPELIGISARAEVLIDVEPGKIKSVTKKLADQSGVSYVASHIGFHDISIIVHARDNKGLFDLINGPISSIPGIVNVVPILVPHLLKFPDQWFSNDMDRNEPPVELAIKSVAQRIQLEEIDRKILNLLIDNGRISVSQISNSLKNYSSRFVRKRIDFFIQEKFLSIKAILSPEKLEYPVRVEMYIKSKSGQAIEVAQQLARLPFTSRVACGIGGDIRVHLHGRDIQEVYDLTSDVVPQISGVKKIHTSIVSELVKDFYNFHLPKHFLS